MKSSWQYFTPEEGGQQLARLDEPSVPTAVTFRMDQVTVDGSTTEYSTDYARGGSAMGAEHDFRSHRRHKLGAKRSRASPPGNDGPLLSACSLSKAKARRKTTSRSPRASLAEQGRRRQ
jgi:hypothetical protein